MTNEQTLEVTTYYLEMLDPAALRPGRPAPRPLAVIESVVPFPALNRFLYTEVGRNYYWTDRLSWEEARWWAWVNRPEQQTWIGYVEGTPAGYFELEAKEGGTVELAYFGLLAPFIGQGLGGALLTEAIRRAWEFAPHQPCQRVCVDTCTLDHPSALGNYQARGFKIYRTYSGQRRLYAAQS